MYTKSPEHVMVIIYDGLKNSVFSSQVLAPLHAELANNAQLRVTLVSFERTPLTKAAQAKYIPPHDRLAVIIKPRLPFFGALSMRTACTQLRKIIAQQTPTALLARGPLAGYLALHARNNSLPLTVQARGLCAEEFRFNAVHEHRAWWQTWCDWWRYCSYRHIERAVYAARGIKIEAVSEALKNYLVTHFAADATRITLATRDIPTLIAPAQRAEWRTDVRVELGIPHNAVVYCYSGSAKSWQCGPKTVAHFKQQQQKDAHAFLLVLSLDTKYFETLLHGIDAQCYRVMAVAPEKVYRYLCAGDVGILLRDEDPVNWVSRPTKLLEYWAAGLRVEHNNTIGMLTLKSAHAGEASQ